MGATRVFLGWDQPPLRLAARWLLEHFAGDLQAVRIVTPGRRAGRRLLEVLTAEAGDALIGPPRTLTLGELPELFYTPPTPVLAAPAPLLVWAQVIASAPADLRKPLHLAGDNAPSPAAVLALARELDQLRTHLAAEGRTIAQTAAELASLLQPPHDERWHAAAELEVRYLDGLHARHVMDQHLARQDALAQSVTHAAEFPLVLLGVPELNPLARTFLARHIGPLHALIAAPPELADAFDALGSAALESWLHRPAPLTPAQVQVVDTPPDQAVQALALLAEHPEAGPDAVTLGVGDETLAPTFQRIFSFADVPTHAAIGRSVSQSAPALLLAAIRQYLTQRSLHELSALLRHEDLRAWLRRTLPGTDEAAATIADPAVVLDEYLDEHLLGPTPHAFLGDETARQQLSAWRDALDQLLGNHSHPQPEPVHDAADWLVHLLDQLYGHRQLNPAQEDDARLHAALQALVRVLTPLREHAELALPAISRAELLGVVLAELARLPWPDPPRSGAIEMLGWLELALDDAPRLLLTGLNEGAIPASRVADPFLPDSLRQRLGMTCDQTRLARDRYLLHLLLHSRHVDLLAARHGLDHEPLAPSRLLLAVEPEQLPAMLDRFLNADSSLSRWRLLEPGDITRFPVPPPVTPAQPLSRLSVTAFKAYLECPYRFYLRYVCRLEPVFPAPVELGPLHFGNVLHEVLNAWAKGPLRDSTNPAALSAHLGHLLDDKLREVVGKHLPAAVRFQREIAADRLAAFAHDQTQARQQGWQVYTPGLERAVELTWDVDGQPFTIHGRIDRVDLHPELGWRVIDYKTGDGGRHPKKHCQTQSSWRDLQLPMYHHLWRAVGDAPAEQPISLAYCNLPKDSANRGFVAANWSDEDLQSAVDCAQQVIRAIRAGVFWPPAAPPHIPDGLDAICHDDCRDRTGLEVSP